MGLNLRTLHSNNKPCIPLAMQIRRVSDECLREKKKEVLTRMKFNLFFYFGPHLNLTELTPAPYFFFLQTSYSQLTSNIQAVLLCFSLFTLTWFTPSHCPRSLSNFSPCHCCTMPPTNNCVTAAPLYRPSHAREN